MKRRLGVLFGVLIAFVFGLFGVPTSQATSFEHSGSPAAYAYDPLYCDGPSSDTAHERPADLRVHRHLEL